MSKLPQSGRHSFPIFAEDQVGLSECTLRRIFLPCCLELHAGSSCTNPPGHGSACGLHLC